MLIEPLCRDHPCLVVGSAPCVIDDLGRLASMSDDTVIIGANGGARIAYDYFGRCDVLCTTSHLYQARLDHERITVGKLSNLILHSIYVDVKSGYDGIQNLPISHRIRFVTDRQRRKIVQQACDIDVWVSTGVFAVCLAKVSGADYTLTAGISFSDGHYGIEDNHPRMHVEADRRAMDVLC